MATVICGAVRAGINLAAGTIRQQKDYFEGLPSIGNLVEGTINVRLCNQNYKVLAVDYSFWGIE